MTSFDEFWAIYPKKRAKADARKAWKQMRLDQNKETVVKIMSVIVKFKAHRDWQRDEGQYIPLPATFIRGERWEDELDIDFGKEAMRW